MDKYRIENVVCYPFRTAILVDNGTIEGQIGEGCRLSDLGGDIFFDGSTRSGTVCVDSSTQSETVSESENTEKTTTGDETEGKKSSVCKEVEAKESKKESEDLTESLTKLDISQ